MSEIYNQKCANINVASPRIQANEKWLVYGTGEPTGWGLSVAEGATVTLSNVYLSDASIRYMGNNTIILADGTTNIVTEVNVGSPAIDGRMATGKTLTITGTGTLNVTGKDYNPAIGAPDGSCGDIIIESTVHLTATAGADVSKAITTNGGRHRPPSLSKPPETPTFRLESGRYETGNLNYELKNQEKLRLSIRISYLFTYHISNISLIHL